MSSFLVPQWWRIILWCTRPGFNLWLEKIPWRRKWQPTPVLLPGKSHGQRTWQATVPGVAKSQTQLSIKQHMNFKSTFFNIDRLWQNINHIKCVNNHNLLICQCTRSLGFIIVASKEQWSEWACWTWRAMLCYVTKESKIFADHKTCLFLTSIACPSKVDGHLWSLSSHSETDSGRHTPSSGCRAGGRAGYVRGATLWLLKASAHFISSDHSHSPGQSKSPDHREVRSCWVPTGRKPSTSVDSSSPPRLPRTSDILKQSVSYCNVFHDYHSICSPAWSSLGRLK